MQRKPTYEELEKTVESLENALSREGLSGNLFRTKQGQAPMNQSWYTNLFEKHLDAIYLIGQDGRILDANKAACRALGVSKEMMRDLLIMDIDPNFCIESFQSFWEGHPNELPRVFESTHKNAEGAAYPVQVMGIPFTEHGHKRFFGIARDMSHRKEAEAKIREKESNFRELIETIEDMVFICTLSGEVVYANPFARKRLGYSRDDFQNLAFWDLFPEDTHADARTFFKAAITTKQDFPLPLRNRDGRRIASETCAWKGKWGEKDAIFLVSKDLSDLQENLHLFERLFRDNPILMALTTIPEGRFVDVNVAFINMLGYSKAEILGNTVANLGLFVHPEKQANVSKLLRKNGNLNNVELQVVTKHGSILEGLFSGEVVYSNGTPYSLTAMSNITEQRKIESALKLQAMVLDQIHDYVTVTDTKGVITYVNNAVKTNLGYTQGELVGLSTEVYGEKSGHGATQQEIFQKTLQDGRWHGEVVNRTIHGREVFLDSRVQKVFDDSGECIALCGVSTDITERKKIEQDLIKSKEQYVLAINGARDGIWDWDLHDNSLFLSPRWKEMIGYCDEELPNIFSSFEDRLHPEDKPVVLKYVENYLLGKTPAYSIEFRLRHKDGSYRWIQARGGALRDENGVPYRMAGSHTDITEQKSFEEKIQQAQKMESIANLASGIAHDFNNILTPIMGLAEMLTEDLRTGSPEQIKVKEIFKASERARDLISQILAFGRKSEEKLGPVKFQYILDDVLTLCRSSIPKNIEIQSAIQKNCGAIWANATQLHQIAMNLITNAYHAMENMDGAKIEVSLREVDRGSDDHGSSEILGDRQLLFSVSDTGAGIPPEIMDKIFEPYFTTKKQGKGTGLGLAVVYGILKEYGGDIRIESDVGKGSTFHLYFPMMEKPGEFERSTEIPKIKTGHEHILIVDDEPALVNLVKTLLNRLGYQVTARLGAMEALEAFKANPENYDAVISDMAMPKMTGDRLAAEMKKIRPDIPVMICTGFSERLNKEKAEAIGIEGFLMKPFNKNNLAVMLRKVLDQAKK
ncbi:PAS domain-containing hybrid sensor histidine kinase/response regulator [Desulfatibacillum aliphaticivorans]|uniref:PAS domain-containing hybrid sensor histidine kinase/response regulator n=1 Tax=Desulfatibacillum aliphaticivorans TaxID=218208 RepID=UPI0003F6B362|nr:PAS domain S-box protein [Desulfatibacillum aliphaticivorans]